MNIDDYLTVTHEINLPLASIVRELPWPHRLALVRDICESLSKGESIAEIRGIVNQPSLNDA